MSRHAAGWLAERLKKKPDALVCLASGQTPTRTYELLTQIHITEPQLFANMRVIKLDEWGGLPIDDPATCEQHLRRALIEPLELVDRVAGAESSKPRYISFAAHNPAPERECDRIAAWLAKNGPIDVCV